MARRTKQEPLPDDFEEHILDTDIRDEMQTSFLEYAYSVIYSRALPDARDGLKPVQRRILYTMDDMSLRPERGHVKSARVVGEVMGRLHPHGDGAIYDALVRMAQPWSMRLPTVDAGEGSPTAVKSGAKSSFASQVTSPETEAACARRAGAFGFRAGIHSFFRHLRVLRALQLYDHRKRDRRGDTGGVLHY